MSSWWSRWFWGRTKEAASAATNHRRGKCRRIVRDWTSARARPLTRWSTTGAPSKRSSKRSKTAIKKARTASRSAASSTSTPRQQPAPVTFPFDHRFNSNPFVSMVKWWTDNSFQLICLRFHRNRRCLHATRYRHRKPTSLHIRLATILSYPASAHHRMQNWRKKPKPTTMEQVNLPPNR